jgi:hypothetical protein
MKTSPSLTGELYPNVVTSRAAISEKNTQKKSAPAILLFSGELGHLSN